MNCVELWSVNADPWFASEVSFLFFSGEAVKDPGRIKLELMNTRARHPGS